MRYMNFSCRYLKHDILVVDQETLYCKDTCTNIPTSGEMRPGSADEIDGTRYSLLFGCHLVIY